ncbi:MAG TPA: hypothetical protein VIE65_14160 [Methylobacter sp.]
MDGVLGDRFTWIGDARRLRPVTFDYACANFPRLIAELKRGHLLVSRQQSVEHPEVIIIYNPKKTHDRWVLLGTDFDIITDIATNSVLRLFSSDTEASIEARILTQVKLKFAGRGIPI